MTVIADGSRRIAPRFAISDLTLWSLGAANRNVNAINIGGGEMSFCYRAIAASALLSLAVTASIGGAVAADLEVKAVAKPVPDLPFFFVIDDRLTYSYIFSATDPSQFTVRPDGSINGKTTKSVYSFTHFDAWAYGTNLFSISMFKSDKNDSAAPCTAPGITITGAAANCAGASEFYGFVRSESGVSG